MAETDYPIDPKTGRIDIPCSPPNTPGNPSRQVMRLGMVGGRRADTDATVAPISDVNNFVMLPDGSGMRVRDGFAYTDRYAIQTSPSGRQALMVETAPWNIPISFRHMILPTGNGIPYVSEAEYVRDRSQAISEAATAAAYFEFASHGANVGLTIMIPVNRGGTHAFDGTVRYSTRDGSAIAGIDYTAESGDVVLSYGSSQGLITLTGTNLGSEDKYFFVDLLDPSQGLSLGQFSTIVVVISI